MRHTVLGPTMSRRVGFSPQISHMLPRLCTKNEPDDIILATSFSSLQEEALSSFKLNINADVALEEQLM